MIYWGYFFVHTKIHIKTRATPKMESPRVICAKHIPKFGNMILTKKSCAFGQCFAKVSNIIVTAKE